MALPRYTSKQLEKDVEDLNKKLEKLNHEFRFVVGGRYGYTVIDLATPEQMRIYCCQRMLESGTPREGLSACHSYLAGLV